MVILPQYQMIRVIQVALEKCKLPIKTREYALELTLERIFLFRIIEMKNLVNAFISTLLIIVISNTAFAQLPPSSEVYQQLKEKDSLLFDVGFNTCNTETFEALIHEDFEFYHDKSGILRSKIEFIDQIKSGLCKSPATYQARRELVSGSMKVFLLQNQGEIYGALQKGIHTFYEKQKGKPETIGSTARFTHLWLLIDGSWKFSRAYSYDHL